MELDILFLGMLFPREVEADIKRKMRTGMQEAANALQWNIIDGLEANGCGRLKILNYLPVNSYPRGYEDKTIESFVFQHTDKYRADDLNVGCTNLSIIKHFVNLYPFKREVRKWARNKSGARKVLIAYSASAMFLKLAKYAKKCNAEIETSCVIADIPEFVTAQTLRGMRKIYNDYRSKESGRLYRYIDKFVLLTEQMAQKLKITVPYIVMEGISTDINTRLDEQIAERYAGERYILYSGTLNYKFGIADLLDAFSQIDDRDIKLMICGFGEADELIRERQKTDERIIYLGVVDRDKVLALQRQAVLLVNPRKNNEEFTKYSFPSKNLEYLSAGVPVVAYRLDGIPDEYKKYLLYVEDDGAEALAKKLRSIFCMNEAERREIGKKGRRFVLSEKNALAQTRRILALLSR